jgi:hypothetical protein
MFALQLPALRVIGLRGPNVARSGGIAPAALPPSTPAAAPAAGRAPRTAHAPAARAGVPLADVDPDGLRVVPLRPDSSWPLRRGYDRVASPFRAFPYRSLHLTRMMSPVDPRD